MSKQLYPNDIDCGWLCIDSAGNVGIFITAGVAPIPIHVLKVPDMAIEDVEASVLNLPKRSAVQLLITVPTPDSFVDLAARGLYVYDWQDAHRTQQDSIGAYVAVATPIHPLKFNELPPNLASFAAVTVLSETDFAATKEVAPSRWFDCLEGE